MSLELTNKQTNVFWNHVIKTEKCWIWTGSTTKEGYGQFFSKKKRLYAHRISFELLIGNIPKNKPELDHYCHVRQCVNPDHMLPTDRSGNLRNRKDRTPYCNKSRKQSLQIIKKICPNRHSVDLLKVDISTGQVKCFYCVEEQRKNQILKNLQKTNTKETIRKAEINFGYNFKAAVKLLLYSKGINCYGKSIIRALKWMEKYDLNIDELAEYYGLIETKTRLRKPMYQPLKLDVFDT